MKKKTAVNTLFFGAVLLMVYLFVAQGLVEFYFSGKKEILQTANHINNLCNADGSCPLKLEGWEGKNGKLRKGRLLYIPTPVPGSENTESFKLNFRSSITAHNYLIRQGFRLAPGLKIPIFP